MEPHRRSKRKPLSDCTNILPTTRRKKPQSLTSSKIPNSQTLIKPPKPSNITSTNVNKDVNLPTNSSQKSHTSIGSNNSSDSVTVPSIPHSSAPPTPVSDAGGRDSDKSGLSVDQRQRHDATTRKDKGEMIAEVPTIPSSAPAHMASEPLQVASSSTPHHRHDATLRKDKGKMVADIPIIPYFAHMASKPLRIASSSSPPRTSRRSRYETQGVQSQNLHLQTIKDKRKTTVDASLISKQVEISSSGTSGSLFETAAHSQNLLEETWKDKDKTVLETPNVEEAEPSTPHSTLASPAASGGKNSDKFGLSVDQTQKHDATTRKDKGKMIAEIPAIPSSASARMASEPLQIASSSSAHQRHVATLRKDKGKMVADIPIIPYFAHMASKPLRIGSSTSPRRSRDENEAVQSQNLHAQTTKDKGKTTLDASLISKQLEILSSGASGSSLSETAAHSQKLHEETRKDKDKTISETLNMEEPEPSTPHTSLASPAASGIRGRPVTVYKQRRARSGRKHGVGKINLSSSHSEQRTRKTGLELDDDRSNKKGSHTDPLPVRKKKQFHGKHGGPTHAMSQEEIEKLRAYYADIDAFELPEEVASENDLE